MKTFCTVFFLLIVISIQAQIVINELDCDSPGFDNKEFIELKSEVPNFPLDGYVLVFFNGSNSGGDKSYYTIDLDGGTTDINGLFVIASDQLNPFPQHIIPESVFQNGADGVGLYLGSFFDFPEGTLATTTNLIDAMVYGTNDATDANMLALLGETVQYNDNGTTANPKSIQRYVDAMGNESFSSATPTPRQENDGSGIVLNPIEITVSSNQINEGNVLDVTFTAQNMVTSPINFNIDLNNGTFNTSDFTGNTVLQISMGQNSVSTQITLTDDLVDEGDEVLVIAMNNLISPVIAYNNFVKIRVVDNDFVVASYGTPVNPTFGTIQSTQPVGYYDALNGLSGTSLEQAIQDIIANPSVVRAQTYSDVIDMLEEADVSPENSNKVWLVYSEESRSILDYQTGSTSTGKWNREHTFPRSLANYQSIEADEVRDGKDIFWTTKADSLRHGNSDAHALRAADGPENSSRGAQHYGQYEGPVGNQGSFKGDVARSVLFLQLRYNGLSVENGFPTIDGQMGDLATLLNWHRNDPPDDFEMNRNNVIYTWQFNRNPLIDMPDLVEYIWGVNQGDTWSNTLSIPNLSLEADSLILYPNPSNGLFKFNGLKNEYDLKIYNSLGQLVFHKVKNKPSAAIQSNLRDGVYLVQVKENQKTLFKKLMIYN